MADRPSKRGESLSFDFSAPPPSATPPVTEPPPISPPPPSVSPPPSVEPAPPPVSAPSEHKKDEPRILSVAQLGRVVGRSLERTFYESFWVEGEVRGARPSASGHVYFGLKDEQEDATIDVVLYRSQVTPRGRALVKDGARVRVRGKPTYYSPRGKIQFIGDRIDPTGKGALLEALEKLKEKLRAEGLFARERKRPLPIEARVVGVVTSATGAVIHDICQVAFRRGGARILLAPAQVQGAGAVDSIRRALSMLQKIPSVDVIIIGRGGGSQDDLLPFNDEAIVRDVAACRVPIVSAIGHEVDVTLVDFAADARAATPSQAAEMVVPDRAARRKLLEERTSRLHRAMRSRLSEDRLRTNELARAFGDPRLLIANAQQRIDEHLARLGRIMSKRFAKDREASAHLANRLGAAHPRARIARDQARLGEGATRLVTAMHSLLKHRQAAIIDVPRLEKASREQVKHDRSKLMSLAGRLDAMSPLKVLGRGYAIVTRPADGHAIRAADEVVPGDDLRVRVGSGSFDVKVKGDGK
jgi:exodeoxyribonuclease VII large subunit